MIHSSGLPVNFYTTGSWDRAVEKRVDAAWFHASLKNPTTRIHIVWQGRTLVRHEDHAALNILDAALYSDLVDMARSIVLLGCDAEAAHIAVDISGQPESFVTNLGHAVDLRAIGPLLPPREASLSALARGMAYWHERHMFCGVCGAPSVSEQAGYQRRCSNAACNAVFFPRIDPAVICASSMATASCSAARRAGRRACIRCWPASSSRANRWKTPCGARCTRKSA